MMTLNVFSLKTGKQVAAWNGWVSEAPSAGGIHDTLFLAFPIAVVCENGLLWGIVV